MLIPSIDSIQTIDNSGEAAAASIECDRPPIPCEVYHFTLCDSEQSVRQFLHSL